MLEKLKNSIKNNNCGLYFYLIKLYLLIKTIILNFKGLIYFFRDRKTFIKLAKAQSIKIKGYYPILTDRFENAGLIDNHYFLQDIYVANKILSNNTTEHIDLGSSLNFLGHLLSSDKIEKVTMLDVRPLSIKINKLDFIQTDATNLKEIKDASIKSISSLHALEHFGLGRYGDPIDPLSCFKAMNSMKRVLAPNGLLYISIPISTTDEVWFNGLRKFSPITIINQFKELELLEFSIIHDFKVYTYNDKNISAMLEKNEISIDSSDCGIFIFKK